MKAGRGGVGRRGGVDRERNVIQFNNQWTQEIQARQLQIPLGENRKEYDAQDSKWLIYSRSHEGKYWSGWHRCMKQVVAASMHETSGGSTERRGSLKVRARR